MQIENKFLFPYDLFHFLSFIPEVRIPLIKTIVARSKTKSNLNHFASQKILFSLKTIRIKVFRVSETNSIR